MVEKYKELTSLAFEFQNKIVDPQYNGNYYLAIQELMKKALEEKHE